MTLASATRRNEYVGNGATATYNYTFRIDSEDDLSVYTRDPSTQIQTALTLNVDYTVTGVRDTTGGTIVLTAGNLAASTILVIIGGRDELQSTDIRNQDQIYQETHEDAFDQIVMLVQQLAEEVDRCVKLPVSYNPSTYNPELPAVEAETGWQWNTSGTALEALDFADLDVVGLPGAGGLLAYDGTNPTLLGREIKVSGSAVSVANGDGISGNPTITVTGAEVDTSNWGSRPAAGTQGRQWVPADLTVSGTAAYVQVDTGTAWVTTKDVFELDAWVALGKLDQTWTVEKCILNTIPDADDTDVLNNWVRWPRGLEVVPGGAQADQYRHWSYDLSQRRTSVLVIGCTRNHSGQYHSGIFASDGLNNQGMDEGYWIKVSSAAPDIALSREATGGWGDVATDSDIAMTGTRDCPMQMLGLHTSGVTITGALRADSMWMFPNDLYEVAGGGAILYQKCGFQAYAGTGDEFIFGLPFVCFAKG
jgi:hypothetical protein